MLFKSIALILSLILTQVSSTLDISKLTLDGKRDFVLEVTEGLIVLLDVAML